MREYSIKYFPSVKSHNIKTIEKEIQTTDLEIQEKQENHHILDPEKNADITAALPSENSQEIFQRINKNMWDKQLEKEKQYYNNTILDSQISDKLKQKSLEIEKKKNELKERLDQLNKLKLDDIKEKYKNVEKAQRYYNELSIQAHFQKQIHDIEENMYKESIPTPKELTPPPRIFLSSQIEKTPDQNMSGKKIPNYMMFTRKTPKTIIYNPITGELKNIKTEQNQSFTYLNKKDFSRDTYKDKKYFFQGAGNTIIKGS